MSRDSVRIALTIAALNNLDVMHADIQNAYLNASYDEHIWVVLGKTIGLELCGKRAKITRALNGLKSAAASYRNHLASGLKHWDSQASWQIRIFGFNQLSEQEGR